LVSKDLWDEEKDKTYRDEREAYVKSEFKKVENSEDVNLEEVFDYIYAERTDVIQKEYEYLKKRSQEVE
jgi:pyruvate dehydrogenase E1 component alpha subunit